MPDGNPTLENALGLLTVERHINSVSNVILFVILPLALVFEAMIVYRVVSEYATQPERCWSIQKAQDAYVKLNQCTGESFILSQKKIKKPLPDNHSRYGDT